jgi:propanediol dehydratase small subunit
LLEKVYGDLLTRQPKVARDFMARSMAAYYNQIAKDQLNNQRAIARVHEAVRDYTALKELLLEQAARLDA